MVIMDLGIGAKLNATVFCEIDTKARDNIPGTEGVGYAVSMWERIQPEVAGVDHFHYHSGRKALEW